MPQPRPNRAAAAPNSKLPARRGTRAVSTFPNKSGCRFRDSNTETVWIRQDGSFTAPGVLPSPTVAFFEFGTLKQRPKAQPWRTTSSTNAPAPIRSLGTAVQRSAMPESSGCCCCVGGVAGLGGFRDPLVNFRGLSILFLSSFFGVWQRRICNVDRCQCQVMGICVC